MFQSNLTLTVFIFTYVFISINIYAILFCLFFFSGVTHLTLLRRYFWLHTQESHLAGEGIKCQRFELTLAKRKANALPTVLWLGPLNLFFSNWYIFSWNLCINSCNLFAKPHPRHAFLSVQAWLYYISLKLI